MTTAGQPSTPPRRKFWANKSFLITLGVVLLVGGLWLALKDSATLSFRFLLDGKPLLVGTAPKVELDGRPFTSGLTVAPGPHRLTANLENAEPFEQRVWVFFGDKDLGSLALASSRGSLLVAVSPAPARVTVRRGLEVAGSGNAPLTVEKLVPGSYELEITRGDYKEIHPVKVRGRQRTEEKIDLNLGSVNLSSDPADAEFQLSGNGRQWDGKLPMLIEDVPGGDYLFTARRKGWEVSTTLSVARGPVHPEKIEFPYGSIELAGDPAGLAVTVDGVAAGKAPVTLRELKPGSYTVAATDGENELKADLTVGPREQVRYSFAFRYGEVRLGSTPTGATVIRKGREIGTTPLTLPHLAVGLGGVVELRLQGYEAVVDFPLTVVEGVTTNLNAKLFSEPYLQAMKQAGDALRAAQFSEFRTFVTAALESEPNDPAALKLREEGVKAEEAWRAERADADARALASLPWLDFDGMISDCTDTRQVQYTVELADGYYQEYIDQNNGKKRQRFVQTGTHTETRTRMEATFNSSRFSDKYLGRTFRFNCTNEWRVLKVEKDAGITLKAGGMGSAEIKVTASWSNRETLNSLKKGQKVALKGVLRKYDAGGLFVPRSLLLEDAELLGDGGTSLLTSAPSKPKSQGSVAGGNPAVVSPAREGAAPPANGGAVSGTGDASVFNGVPVFDISNVDQAPAPIRRVPPQYPFEMSRAGITGDVLVDFLVDTNGNVQNASAVKSSQREFEAAALQAVGKWKFKPGRKGGREVVTHMQTPIAFSLNQE